MAKLYFKYGVMGSSKTAQALMTKFNYEQAKKQVLFLKPSTDTREGENIVKSRIGLEAEAQVLDKRDKPLDLQYAYSFDVIIIDEAQFLTPAQVEFFKDIAVFGDVPVLCYGLKDDFQTKMFPGSKRLFELADSLQEIKMVCNCGRKATVNARLVKAKSLPKVSRYFLEAMKHIKQCAINAGKCLKWNKPYKISMGFLCLFYFYKKI